MGRKNRSSRRKSSRKGNVYLGKRVRDTGRPGLDNLREVRGIANAIIYDYTHHKIPYRTAMSRMNLLELVVSRDSDFEGIKEAQARAIVDRARIRLMKMRH